MKKIAVVIMSVFSLSAWAATNEISLDLGTDFISGYPGSNDTGIGPSFQLGYQYNLDENIAFYMGVAIGDDSFSSITVDLVSALFAGALTGSVIPVEEHQYTTIPLAAQFNYPIDNNLLFLRAGGNVYWVQTSNIYNPADQSLSSSKSSGVGVYGAAGWRYYFGDTNEWGVGLTYQYIGLKRSLYSQVGSFTISYGF